jgi:hypothetical protein
MRNTYYSITVWLSGCVYSAGRRSNWPGWPVSGRMTCFAPVWILNGETIRGAVNWFGYSKSKRQPGISIFPSLANFQNLCHSRYWPFVKLYERIRQVLEIVDAAFTRLADLAPPAPGGSSASRILAGNSVREDVERRGRAEDVMSANAISGQRWRTHPRDGVGGP